MKLFSLRVFLVGFSFFMLLTILKAPVFILAYFVFLVVAIILFGLSFIIFKKKEEQNEEVSD